MPNATKGDIVETVRMRDGTSLHVSECNADVDHNRIDRVWYTNQIRTRADEIVAAVGLQV